MNKGKSPIKIKNLSSPSMHPLKTSSTISYDTVHSEKEVVSTHKKQKNTLIPKSIQEKIERAYALRQNIRRMTNNDKNANHTEETPNHQNQQDRQHENSEEHRPHLKQAHLANSVESTHKEPQPTIKISSAKSLCANSLSSLLKKSQQSGKNSFQRSQQLQKKYWSQKQSQLLKPRETISNFKEVGEIESFMLDEDDELEMSIVEEHGENVLNWEVCHGKASEFKILKFIDQGRFGKVYLAQSYRNGLIFSIKTLYRSAMDAETFPQLIREVKIQSFLDHPNIVKLFHFFVDEESAYLVLEPCLGKNLYQNLKQNGKMSEKQVKQYIKQVCNAVEYMHKNDIIHRDLKPENILLHQNTIKICDFGWAVHSPMLRATQCGTPVYTSPEIVKKLPYDSKIDIWSIGILTYQLLYGMIPFEIRHIDDLIKITEQEVYFSQDLTISQAAQDFMAGCLEKNPLKRFSIRQALQHQFLCKTDKFRLTMG